MTVPQLKSVTSLKNCQLINLVIVLLKRCSQIISLILSKFHNLFMTLSSGTFPVILKTGRYS